MSKRNQDTVIVYEDKDFALFQKENGLFFRADGREYALSCQPYEPCMYVKQDEKLVCAIHNSFDPDRVFAAFRKEETVESITGKIYDPAEFCEMLAYAVEKIDDADISYVEGGMAVQRLKELGAISPEKAVDLKRLKVRSISDAYSHSKNRKERVMYTEDGKVYLAIKEKE